MKYALKEGAITIEALAHGDIIAIWTKEDIKNLSTESNSELNKFVLLPLYNQDILENTKKEFWNYCNVNTTNNSKLNKENQVLVKYWAEITEILEINELKKLINISSQLSNTDENLITSFNRNPSLSGKILILRTYSLSHQILVPLPKEQELNTSIVELKIDIPKIRSKPILSFKDFNQKLRLLKSQMNTDEYTDFPKFIESIVQNQN